MLGVEVFALAYSRSLLTALGAVVLITTCGTLAGCSGDRATPPPIVPMADGGPALPVRVLSVSDFPGPRTLLFGETLAFTVRYAERDGRAVSGGAIGFSMIGVAHDSSLTQTTAVSDADGFAQGALLAGNTPAAFRVRASAVDAAPVTFDVAVGNAGFGAVRAEVHYLGTRAIVARTVAIYGGASCESTVTVATPDREQPLVELDTAARFAALPAGLTYAVVARGAGADGTLLTRGCIDGVLVESGVEAATVVTMEDVAVTAAGSYEVALDVNVPGAGESLRAAAAAVVTVIEASGGDARLMLDAIALDVADRDPTAADTFAAARLNDSLDTSLGTALSASSTRPTMALTVLSSTAADALSTLRVTGVLELDARGVAAPDGFRDVQVWSLSLSSMPVEIAAVGPTGAPTALTVAGFSSARSLVIISALDLRMWLGSTARAVLDALASARSASRGFAGLVSDDGGCDAVVRWAEVTPAVSAVCSSSCVRAACDSVSSALVTTLSELLTSLDAERELLHLEGELAAVDSDADTRLDSLGPSSLTGTWSSASATSADDASATARATRR